jgi:hypothetical protein
MVRVVLGRSGQSLIEILIAVVVGVIMILGTAAIIAPALKSHTASTRGQVAGALGKELLDNVHVFAEADWHNITRLVSGPGTVYYLNATTSPFSSVTGTQSIVIATTTYTRYFYVEPVNRDSSGYIATGGTINDPSTKKITVVSGWTGGPTSSLATYLTRHRLQLHIQTDWTGGPTQEGPLTTVNARFASSSSNANYTSTVGSVMIRF